MNLVSVRIIAGDVSQTVDFYEEVTGIDARWATPEFAEIVTPACTLAIGSARTATLFGDGTAVPAHNRSVIVELRVDDVDSEVARLQGAGLSFVQEPTTMPWGNRSALLRDPDGTLVNLFAPLSAGARERFDG